MSVISLSSVRGWKTKDLFLMPSTQAESGELAKMRPAVWDEGSVNCTSYSLIYILLVMSCLYHVCNIPSACQSTKGQIWLPFWWQNSYRKDWVFHPNDKGIYDSELGDKPVCEEDPCRSPHLLHMSKYILPAVKHTLALFWVQVKDKVCGVVCIAFLISDKKNEVQYWMRIIPGCLFVLTLN